MSDPALGSSDLLLLVDDNPAMLQLLRKMLDGRGYELVTAQDGREGFTTACERHPSLILLDVNMPIQNGFETCRALKADPRTQESAVILLSARNEVKDKVQGLELGAVDYITKPFQVEEVIARVNTQMAIRRQSRELHLRWREMERFNRRQEMYDLSRLLGCLAEAGGAGAQAALDTLVADVERYAQGRPAHDDQTMMLGVVG